MKDKSISVSSTHKGLPSPPVDMHEAICRRAEEIYIRNGRIPGHDLENWMQAEAEIFRDSVQARNTNRAVIVKVNGVQYVGEYDPGSAAGYLPGEFATGQSVRVRLEGEKMFVQRANQVELETTIVKKLR